MIVEFESELFRWDARDDASWYFVAVPAELSGLIREIPRPVRGFGAVAVEATVGRSVWRTSVFPDAASGCYHLPVKRAVRLGEGIDEGDTVTVTLAVRDA